MGKSTSNEQYKKRQYKNNPTYSCIQEDGVPWNKLKQEISNLYTENYKTFLKAIREYINLNKWKDTPCSYIRRCNTKMSVLPRVIYRFKAIPVKIPKALYAEMEKLILKFIWNLQGVPKIQENF